DALAVGRAGAVCRARRGLDLRAALLGRALRRGPRLRSGHTGARGGDARGAPRGRSGETNRMKRRANGPTRTSSPDPRVARGSGGNDIGLRPETGGRSVRAVLRGER